MKKKYDFSNAKPSPFAAMSKGKTRITIRLDSDIINWFKKQVEDAGGGNYQSMINLALRRYIEQSNEPMEKMLRRVLREELKKAG